MTRNKTVAPKPAPAKAKRVKKTKAELHIVQHRTLGSGVLRFVRVLDSGEFAARVEFADGVERVLLLDEKWWITPIVEMMKAQPEPARKYAPEPKPKPADDETEESGDAAELEFAGGHLLAETEGEIEEDGEREVADSEEGLETEDSESAEVEEVLA
jgi:hypothetical protein